MKFPITDYVIWAIGKVSIAIAFFIASGLFCLFIYFIIIILVNDRAAEVAVNVAISLVTALSILLAMMFRSKKYLSWLLSTRRKNNKIFVMLHPIVQEVTPKDSQKIKIKKLTAIAVLESKCYSMVFSLVIIAYYIVIVFVNSHLNRNWFECTDGECEIGTYIIKSMGFGLLFVFIDSYGIEITNVRVNNIYLNTWSFLSNVVFVSIFVRLLLLVLKLRQRFSEVLRPEALTLEEAMRRLAPPHIPR